MNDAQRKQVSLCVSIIHNPKKKDERNQEKIAMLWGKKKGGGGMLHSFQIPDILESPGPGFPELQLPADTGPIIIFSLLFYNSS